MREIKFRAWDGKAMYMPDELIQVGEEGITTGYLDGSGCPKYTDHVLMQFTGLKDKNGVDAYEDDIIRFEFEYETGGYAGGEPETDIETVIARVEFSGGGFGLDMPGSQYEGMPLDACDFEVIGNIYENPELLESPGA